MRYALNTAPINGGARLYGKSTALLISVNASGFSAKQKYAQSAAVLVALNVTGTAKMAKTARSEAPMIVEADGLGKLARRGDPRTGEVVVGARHGIPNPMPRSPKVGPAHRSRVVMVQAGNQVVIIPAENREVNG